MKKTIRRIKFFTIFDYDKEEIYLREMHAKGYSFVSVSLPGIYTFEVNKPRDVVYKLDFMNDALDLDNKLNYLQIFKNDGWEIITNFMGFSYFRKDAELKNTEIFSDDISKLEMIKRIFKSRILPILIIFGVVVLPPVPDDTFNLINDNPSPIVFFRLSVFIIYTLLFINLILGYFRITNKLRTK